MYKFMAIIGCFLALSSHAQVSTTLSAAQILANADSFRASQSGTLSSTRVEAFDGERKIKERRYHVYSMPPARSLVVFQHGSERGQKLLMRGNDYWIFMPNSKRPIRITPLQRVVGEAAIGDIATLSWAEHYRATISGKRIINQRECIELELVATASGLSYSRIELSVDAQGYWPVAAKLYLQSGKLAKVAQFRIDNSSSPAHLSAMELRDAITPSKHTLLHYEQRQQQDIPEKFFNPAYLAQATLTL